uniref:Secreted protein n=1 Tax=Macrostomum lignano TaxID=282301 RepID=A0A1I8FEX7_9PLAT
PSATFKPAGAAFPWFAEAVRPAELQRRREWPRNGLDEMSAEPEAAPLPDRQKTSCRRCSGLCIVRSGGRSGCCRPPTGLRSQTCCGSARTPGTRRGADGVGSGTPPPQLLLPYTQRDASAADRLARSLRPAVTGRRNRVPGTPRALRAHCSAPATLGRDASAARIWQPGGQLQKQPQALFRLVMTCRADLRPAAATTARYCRLRSKSLVDMADHLQSIACREC